MQSYHRVLKNRPFVMLWLGQTISRLGDVLYYAGMLWLVKELTNSNTAMGLAGMAMALPQLLGPIAGVYVDRWPRRWVMLGSDLLRGLLVLLVPLLSWLGVLQAWHVIAAVFALSLVSQFFFPAKQSIMPELLQREDLMVANSLDSTTTAGMNVLGFATSGMLIAWIGPVHLFSADGATFLISALFIMLMGQIAQNPAQHPAQRAEQGPGSEPGEIAGSARPSRRAEVNRELIEGFRYLVQTPLTRVLMPIMVLLNFGLTPFNVLLASYADDVLLAGAEGFGYLTGAEATGMLLGSILMPALATRISKAALVSGGFLVVGLGELALAVSTSLLWGVTAMFVLGVALSAVNIVLTTMLQSLVPGHMQGRVFSTVATLVSIASPLGMGLSGFLADQVSLTAVFLAFTLITLGTAAVSAIPVARALSAGESQPVAEAS